MTHHKPLLAALIIVAASLQLAACGSAADRKARYVAHGEQYLAEKNWQKARIEFRNALQIDPRDAHAHELAGQAAEKLGELREALGQFQAAIDLDATRNPSRAALARLYVMGGASEHALELIAPGLEKTPNDAALLTARAAAKSRLGDTQGSRADAEAAYVLAPDNDYTVSVLASLCKRDGDSARALEVVRAGVQRLPNSVDLRTVLADLDFEQKNYPEAETQLRKAIELDPTNADHRYFLARFYLLRNDVDGAEKTLREAVAADLPKAQPKIALVQFLAEHRSPELAEAELRKLVKAEPEDSELQLALGSFLAKQNKLDQAQGVYQGMIKSFGTKPPGLSARDRLAELALRGNDTATGERLIAEVLKENPRDADALTLRAQLALSRGDAVSAIADLRNVQREQPDSLLVLRNLARAHLQNGEPGLAEEVLHTAVEAHPKDVDARTDYAQVLMQTGKTDQARPILDQLVLELPDNLGLQEGLFRAQMAKKDYKAAAALAQALEARHTDQPLGFFFSGLVEEQQQKLAEARRDFERALAIQPAGAEPLAALVGLDIREQQPAKALARLDALIDKAPDNLYARNLKGETLMAQKQYAQAAQVYQDAIARNSKLAMFYSHLAAAQLADKQDDAAVATLRQGIAVSSEPGGLVTELALLQERRGKLDDAVATYDEALKRDPTHQPTINNLAMLLVTHRQDRASLDRAVSLVDQLQGSPNPVFIDTRGWVYYKTGRYQDALPLLQQAVDKAPASPALRFHLAMAQHRTGDVVDARGNLEQAVKAGRPFEGIEEARAALKELQGPAS